MWAPTWRLLSFRQPRRGRRNGMSMSLPILLILIGIVLAILVHYGLGIACIVIGLVLLIWPRISSGSTARV